MVDSENPYLAPMDVSVANRVFWFLVFSGTTTVVPGIVIIAAEISFGMSMLVQLLLNIAVPGLCFATIPYYFLSRRWRLRNGRMRPVVWSCLIAACGALQTFGCLTVATVITRWLSDFALGQRLFLPKSHGISICEVALLITIYTFLVVVTVKCVFRHDCTLRLVIPIFVGVACASVEVHLHYSNDRYSIFYPLMVVSRYALLLSWLAHWNCVGLLLSEGVKKGDAAH